MNRRTFIELAAVSAAAASTVNVAAASLAPADAQFTLPKLPYGYDALEPHIDTQTMQIHHDKHHQAYVNNLNNAVATDPSLASVTNVDDLLKRLDTLPAAIKTAVRNNGGGHSNHSLFWQTLGPADKSGKPSGGLAAAIADTFGTQDAFETKLKAAAGGVFGSGWGWLLLDGKKLTIEGTPNQDSPILSGKYAVLGIDVWEHAYYLKYQNRRADYLAAVLKVVNWDFVSKRYNDLVK